MMSSTSTGCFDSMTVKQLQDFLKDKGVSTTGYSKDRLLQLAKAVAALHLESDPDLAGPSHSVELTLREKLQRCGCDFGDPNTVPGFTEDFTEVPDFGLFDVFNYLIVHRADYDRKKLNAYKSFEDYRLFSDGHVEELKFNSVSPTSAVCIFKSSVKPTQKDRTYLNKKTYSSWLIMRQGTGEVVMAYCECPGGSDGACRHVAAVLYEIEAISKKSCTEGPVQWKRRARQHDIPIKMVNLTVKKARYGDDVQCLPSTTKVEFDPRMPADQQPTTESAVKEFATKLAEINPDAGATDFLLGTPEASASRQVRPDVHHLTVAAKLSTGGSGGLTYSADEVDMIERATRDQSANEEWHRQRKGRLTASNFSAIVRSKKDGGGSLTKRIVEGDSMGDDVPAAIEWGRKKEGVALKEYVRVKRRCHKDLEVRASGLVVMAEKGHVGASPDAVASCGCGCAKWLIEVKCPYGERDAYPKEAAVKRGCIVGGGGELVCDQTCPYYTQIQGQMGVCGIEVCDLVVYTRKGICAITVKFDRDFFADMLPILDRFFVKNIRPKLMD